jgi:hypothetical protein
MWSVYLLSPAVWSSAHIEQLKNFWKILTKFDNGEFCEKLSNHFNYHLDQAILKTTSHNELHVLLHEPWA